MEQPKKDIPSGNGKDFQKAKTQPERADDYRFDEEMGTGSSLKSSAKPVLQKIERTVTERPLESIVLALTAASGIGALVYAKHRRANRSRFQEALRHASERAEGAGEAVGSQASRAAEYVKKFGEQSVHEVQQRPFIASAAATGAILALASTLIRSGSSKSFFAKKPPEECSFQELYSLAQKYDIEGRSSMNKKELLSAVQQH